FAARGALLEEGVEVMRKVWAGGMVEHHGRHFAFPELAMEPRPVAPVPIWLGGRRGGGLPRAARHPRRVGPRDSAGGAAAALARLRIHREGAGRLAEPFEAILAVGEAPDRDLFRRLEASGATGFVSYPPAYRLGADTSLDAKRRAIADWMAKARG